MTNPDDFRSVPPTVAPGGEDPTQKRVLASSQSGSLLDLEARELLGRFQHDQNLPKEVRERAGQALRGDGTLRDVLETPAFTEMREAAARRFREELAAMSQEEKDEMARTLRERFSGPFGMPGAGSPS
jgi:hypothetical protein